MKSTMTPSVLIVTIIFMFVLLSIIVIVALFIPVQSAQGDTEISTAINTVPATMDESPLPFAETEKATTSTEFIVPAERQFTLKTIAQNGKLLYIGVGGDIDGLTNPDLVIQPGAVVRIILVNGDGMVHDLFLPDFDIKTEYVRKISDQTEILFETGDMQPGSYVYYCTLPGHRKAGQEGRLIVAND